IELEVINKRRGDLYLDELINKHEFESNRKECEDNIKEIKDQLFTLKKEETSEVAITDIRQAFKNIKQKDKDIHHALKVLIDYVVIHPDGKTDITYKFES